MVETEAGVPQASVRAATVMTATTTTQVQKNPATGSMSALLEAKIHSHERRPHTLCTFLASS